MGLLSIFLQLCFKQGFFYLNYLKIAGIYTLKAKERLKRSKLIDELFSKGSYFTIPFFRVQYQFLPLPFEAALQIGVSVSKRNFKKAVSRNRIKRLLREAVRLQKKELSETLTQNKQQLAVFFIYTGKEIPAPAMVAEQMTLILNRLLKLVNEKHTSNTQFSFHPAYKIIPMDHISLAGAQMSLHTHLLALCY